MGVWNSSKQTEHDIIPVFLLLSLSIKKVLGVNLEMMGPHFNYPDVI